MGNPSDAYGGRALAMEIKDFHAEVTLRPSDRVELVPGPTDQADFRSIHDLSQHVRHHGYYGGRRLLAASARAFADHWAARGLLLDDRGFRISFTSTIPRQVGLAGSSAIVVAALRALMDFYQVDVSVRVLPSLALLVETRELGIGGGLMDRVVQVYGGLVRMDLTAEDMTQVDGYACGGYESLDPALLPDLYVAYGGDMAEPTEAVHGDLGRRYRAGDPAVLRAVSELASLVDAAVEALGNRDPDELGRLMDRNFELRRSVSHVAPAHARMIERARAVGAPAKFAGSGGAIVGVLPSAGVLRRLQAEMDDLGCRVLVPTVGIATPERPEAG